MQFKSALMTDASGSLGGMTASRNRSGMYLRSRVVPVDPATSRQQVQRSIMADLAVEWVDMLPTQRDGWRTYAANVEHTPRFCGPIFLTGQNQFIRTNTVRLQAGLPILFIAPIIFDLGVPLTEPTTAEITQGSPPNSYNVIVPFVSPADAAGTAVLYLSRPYSPSRTYFRGPYQMMQIVSYLNLATQAVFSQNWDLQLTEFNEPAPDTVQSMRFNAITDDGRLSHAENYGITWALDSP